VEKQMAAFYFTEGTMYKRIFLVLTGVSLLTGCATIPDPYTIIQQQKQEIARLQAMLEEREKEFETARNSLMRELRDQIEQGRVKVEQLERGLVLTILEEVLFDSGKAAIKLEGKETLNKVAGVLNEDCPDRWVAIEGHTDNVPIKYSGWRSNWELSTARAESVLHFFIDECGIAPQRFRVTGFGEYMPRASNENEEGRQQNRRVEIVILPEKISKVEAGFK
jgi:chemotaxis protein MotB